MRHSTGVTVPLKLSTDPRFGLPGRPHVIRQQVQLPAEMPLGSYDLLLYLPDPESRLRSRPEYAIRLANRGAWEADTGYNKLNKKIMVVDLVYLPIVLGDTAR